jgi:hypothetical protein
MKLDVKRGMEQRRVSLREVRAHAAKSRNRAVVVSQCLKLDPDNKVYSQRYGVGERLNCYRYC